MTRRVENVPRRSEHAERYLINVNAAGEARAEKKRQLIKLHNLKILKRGFKKGFFGCHPKWKHPMRWRLNREDPKEVARTVPVWYLCGTIPYHYTFERNWTLEILIVY